MNAYVVRTADLRTYVEPVMDDGSGPLIPIQPIAAVTAETPAQAKRVFLDAYAEERCSGVFSDDWTSLRVRLLVRDVDAPRGIVPDAKGDPEENRAEDALYYRCWLRIHEIDDHGGKPCDCPEDPAA